MTDSITPSNITGAAFISQFAIIGIMFVAALILHKGEGTHPLYQGRPHFSELAWKILTFALLTIGCLLFSDEFSRLWHPLLQDASFPTLPWRLSLLVMFFSDILLVTILVAITGGSKDSPFGPLYFLLPTLAILLKEPLGRLLLYVLFTSISFSILLYFNSDISRDERQSRNTEAYLMVSISCFILATFIGYVTRIK